MTTNNPLGQDGSTSLVGHLFAKYLPSDEVALREQLAQARGVELDRASLEKVYTAIEGGMSAEELLRQAQA